MKLKFDDGGVGPCSDCSSDINVNMNTTKSLCPQCQSRYLKKAKVKEVIDSWINTTEVDGKVIIKNKSYDYRQILMIIKKELGL